MEQFNEFAARHNISMTLSRTPSRTDRFDMPGTSDSRPVPEPVHFQLVLTIKHGDQDRTLWSGEYSQGIGYAEAWAKKHKSRFVGLYTTPGHGWPMVDALKTGPGRNRVFRHDSHYWSNIRDVYGRAAQKDDTLLPVCDVLLSLQLDTMGCDVPFEDWAHELGYSPDSMTAHRIWEACNDTRRKLQSAFTAKQWAEFQELEE